MLHSLLKKDSDVSLTCRIKGGNFHPTLISPCISSLLDKFYLLLVWTRYGIPLRQFPSFYKFLHLLSSLLKTSLFPHSPTPVSVLILLNEFVPPSRVTESLPLYTLSTRTRSILPITSCSTS